MGSWNQGIMFTYVLRPLLEPNLFTVRVGDMMARPTTLKGVISTVWWYKHYIKRSQHINAYSTVFPSRRRLGRHPLELLPLRKCRGFRCWLESRLEQGRSIFALETSNAAGIMMTTRIYLIHLRKKSQKLPRTSCSLTSRWLWHHPILRRHRKYSWRVVYHDPPKTANATGKNYI